MRDMVVRLVFGTEPNAEQALLPFESEARRRRNGGDRIDSNFHVIELRPMQGA